MIAQSIYQAVNVYFWKAAKTWMIKEAVASFCENKPFNPTAAGGQQTRRLKFIAITSEPQEVFNETSWLLLKIIYDHFSAKKFFLWDKGIDLMKPLFTFYGRNLKNQPIWKYWLYITIIV